MANKKMIPCRVCGKMFEPCSYCQSHADVFRWRNFACSYKCATEYVEKAVKYRESLHKKDEIVLEEMVDTVIEETVEPQFYKKKSNKKKSIEPIDIESEEIIEKIDYETE